MHAQKIRHLVVVLGDQLDRESAAFDDFDPRSDLVWMAEVAHESEKVWSTKARIAMFLAAMRHFAAALRRDGVRVVYQRVNEGDDLLSLEAALAQSLATLQPQAVILVEPGEWAVREALRLCAKPQGVALDEREDRHFLCSHGEFASHVASRRQLRMEYFYREMRRKLRVLITPSGGPEGGKWNYDAQNRKSFGKSGPVRLREPVAFEPDVLTREVIKDVNRIFPGHPGTLDDFDWPVTREQALTALRDFIDHRLANFGDHQDAMWSDEPWLYHSRLSAALNLKLLNPREVVSAAELAYREKRARLADVEGFIRQIVGWREYARGVYWQLMPGYIEGNALQADAPLPEFFWTGETDMQCLRQTLKQTLRYGYAHHIQRLMVTGLFSLLLGVNPRRIHEWYLAVYVDAVEWVELPNTLGMSQYADGGVMASKPYVASGKYIQRMSNYCDSCRYNPGKSTGEDACPFTTLYWDFLGRHEKQLQGNQRMSLQLRNLARVDSKTRRAIAVRAADLRRLYAVSSAVRRNYQ